MSWMKICIRVRISNLIEANFPFIIIEKLFYYNHLEILESYNYSVTIPYS